MSVENLTITRLMVHEVFVRDDDRNPPTPVYGADLIALEGSGLNALRGRIVQAMGRASRCLKMDIDKTAAGSFFATAKNLLAADDMTFIAQNKAIADSLVTAQLSRRIPGGVLVVFSGTVGHPAKRIFGVIKAEAQNGFHKEQNPTGKLSLAFLDNLFLTPHAKFYKIGMIVEETSNVASPEHPAAGFWAYLYDDGINPKDQSGAAKYFYETFLGFKFPTSSAYLTKQFFTHTRQFIVDSTLAEEDKADLLTGLYSYLKVDQSAVVHVSDFATRFLAASDLQEAYENHMRAAEFPENAVVKDLSDVQNQLRQRRISFSSGVKLTAAADHFDDLVKIETIEGEAPDEEAKPVWTLITIRDRIRSQE